MRSRCSAGGMVAARCSASAVSSTWYGLTISASVSSRAAPAKRLRISTPCSSSRAATNSLLTRFMPSCRLVTTQMSAARNSSLTCVVLVVLAPADAPAGSPALPKRWLMRSVARWMRSWKLRYSSSAAARRRGDLHEHEPADPFRMLLEQPLHRVQPLEDALGVVEAVDADGEAGVGRQLQPLEHAAPALGHRRPRLAARPASAIRSRSDSSRSASRSPWNEIVECSCSMRASRKRSTVSMKFLQWKRVWKPRIVLPSMPSQDLAPPRADAERLRVRPRDVPEGEDGGARQLLADHRRQQREVVVLHQHDRVVAARLRDHRVGEALVDVAVVLPVATRGTPAARGPRGTAATGLRWRSRSSSPAPPPR